jgi:small-conductance mechanosensitive channel
LITSAQSGPARSDLDQSGSVDTRPVDAETSALSESPDQASEQGTDRPKLAFDPAQVGLPGFTDPRASAEDYAEIMSLIEARIAELEAEGRNQVQEDATEQTLDPVQDPRIALLGELRTAVQRESVLAARLRELDGALAESQAAAETGEPPDLDLGVEPPYPLRLLDELRAKRSLAEHAREDAARLRSQAERRVAAADRDHEAAVRERRLVRDRLAVARDQAQGQAPDELDMALLERDLEVARLAVLVTLQERESAQVGAALAEREDALAAARLARLETRIAHVAGDVVFTREALDERLAEIQAREEAVRADIASLVEAGDAAELALFQARRRLGLMTSDAADRDRAQEQMLAREAELAAARKGVEYLHQALGLAGSARTLYERRYALLQGEESALWPTWLRETQSLIKDMSDESAFAQAELDALRSMQLALARRLARADLGAGVEQAIRERVGALETQEERAREMLLVKDQVQSLAQRLRDQLDPMVSERSLDQHLDAAKTQLESWWNKELFVIQDHGIYARDLVTGAVVFTLVLVLVSFLRSLLRRTVLPKLVEGSETERKTARAAVLALIHNTSQLFVLIVAFYAAMTVSGLAQGHVKVWLWTLLVVAVYVQVGIWATAGLVDFVQRQRSKKEQQDPSAVTGYGLLLFFLRVGVWIVVVVSVMAHFEYPIAGLIGALGVGGIAVAFAVQNILSDVFHSMAIILDKPFKVGDFVIAGETLGVVDSIGVKTTRIRSLSGEMVVMSNTNLLNSTLRNYKHMRERRVVFKLGVVYETPPDRLERIPKMIEEIVRAQRFTRFDRAHFAAYGDFSLDFEVVYYVIGADFTLYMDIQQAINLAIYRKFQEEGIQFAYPTQELIVRRPPGELGRVSA